MNHNTRYIFQSDGKFFDLLFDFFEAQNKFRYNWLSSDISVAGHSIIREADLQDKINKVLNGEIDCVGLGSNYNSIAFYKEKVVSYFLLGPRRNRKQPNRQIFSTELFYPLLLEWISEYKKAKEKNDTFLSNPDYKVYNVPLSRDIDWETQIISEVYSNRFETSNILCFAPRKMQENQVFDSFYKAYKTIDKIPKSSVCYNINNNDFNIEIYVNSYSKYIVCYLLEMRDEI